ncbi:hypothetical protein [Parageobacillus thermoglucosidasius]|uniref:Uncharacterized protein n=1 Tax=Parageobacillus thermoglucosidasius TaxID=1426 RepID=A0AB38R6C8_PARTM|nr:hypothetical protein [Parageobacillus thermoglucosidasius]UOE78415.1 hypothetical protein IMI45_20165 [Parageobacillus thermoglucosidasius]
MYYLGLFISIVGILGAIYTLRLREKGGDLHTSRVLLIIFCGVVILGNMFMTIELLPDFVSSILSKK